MTCDRYFEGVSWRDTPRTHDRRSFCSRDLIDAHANVMHFTGRRHFGATEEGADFCRRFFRCVCGSLVWLSTIANLLLPFFLPFSFWFRGTERARVEHGFDDANCRV